MSVAAVILAAGSSRRLGRPKQTLIFDGETLVERAARIARDARLSPILAVVNEEAQFAGALQEVGCQVLINHQAAEGIASSIRSGASAAVGAGVSGLIVMTCDQLAVSSELLCQLMAERESVTGSYYAGRIGIPAYFPATSFAALLQLQGDTGARELLRSARTVPWDGLGLDIDTEEDLALARKLFESGAMRFL